MAGDAASPSASVVFSFAGARTIVVRGTATGHIYRFSPGALLRVHGSDAVSMQGIPGLRRWLVSTRAETDTVPG